MGQGKPEALNLTDSLTKSEGFLEFISIYIAVVTRRSDFIKDVIFTVLSKPTAANLKATLEA